MRAVSKFCNDIDAAGIRSKFNRCNLFCGNGGNLLACLVPLYRGPSSTGTQYGNTTDENPGAGPFTSGDYNETGASSGLKGNGSSKYLNTGYPANTLTAANTHLAVSILAAETVGNADKTMLGSYDTGGQVVFSIDARRTNIATNRLCALGLYGVGTLGFFGEDGASASMAQGNIVASAGVQYRDGAAVGTTAPALTDYAQAHSLYIFANNNGAGSGVPVNPSDVRLSLYSIGAAMTESEALAYSNAMTTFNTALSRT
jgi:hypothetical protein